MYPRLLPHPGFVSLRVFPCLLIALLAPSARAADSPAELKAQTDRWIQLEKSIADERNEWRAQQESLAASVHVLRSEQTNLQERLAANELAAGAFKKRLEQAQAEFAAQEAAHTALGTGGDALKQKLLTLVPRLPQPLQDRIQPQLAKLRKPATEDGPTISERTQALVSALTAIEQFNNSLTLTHELRANGAGDTVDVKVLYWGLAGAYAIDATGTHAWIVAPDNTGWAWREAPAEAAAIKSLIAVHEKQENPSFVVLPLGSQGGDK